MSADKQEPEAIRTHILDLMRRRGYRPLNKSELARKLELQPGQRAMLRAELARLEREGVIVSGRRGRYEATSASGSHLVGWLRFQRKGHAWFHPDRGARENANFDVEAIDRVFVPRRDTGTALEGDRVAVRLVERGRPGRSRGGERSDDEPAVIARVERVLERRSGRAVGVFHLRGKHSWVEVDEPAFRGVVEVVGDTTARSGQAVVVAIDEWHGREQTPRGTIIDVLGWPDDAGVAITAIIHRYGLQSGFPDGVLAETGAVAEPPDAGELARREDWRDRPVLTIDPGDAKDHDDAILVERDGGGWHLAVHIADVSHYVKPGTALDREAEARGNSTYLVDRVLPMLPPELSNGICSLKPAADRLTKAVLMKIDAQGRVGETRFVDAVIRSAARLSYEQAQSMLDGGAEPDGVPEGSAAMLRESWRLAGVLRERRFEAGALDLEMPETKVLLDDDGRATGVEPVSHGPSHQLVEECMLVANEAVARLLRTRQKPAVFRIHEEPDPGKLLEFGETAKAQGYQVGELSKRAHIQRLLEAARGKPDEHSIKLGLLKSLKRAAYSAEPLGHYGLAKADYGHFTSPIRRYADLLVHRALQPLLENPPAECDRTPGQARLREIASHISDTERNSAEAENDTRQLKLFEFLESLAAPGGEAVVFSGIITGLRQPGLLVEAVDIGTRGMIKRGDLPGHDWRCEANLGRFIRGDGMELKIGQRIEMTIARVDRDRGFVDFMLR